MGREVGRKGCGKRSGGGRGRGGRGGRKEGRQGEGEKEYPQQRWNDIEILPPPHFLCKSVPGAKAPSHTCKYPHCGPMKEFHYSEKPLPLHKRKCDDDKVSGNITV